MSTVATNSNSELCSFSYDVPIRLLLSETSNTCCFQSFEYDGVICKTLLEENFEDSGSIENRLLQEITSGVEGDDDSKVEKTMFEALKLFRSFLVERHESLRKSFRGSASGRKDVEVNVQFKTVNGCAQFLTHNMVPQPAYECCSVPNKFPDLPSFTLSDVHEISKVNEWISKVQIRGQEYNEVCMKRCLEGTERQFIREITILSQITEQCKHHHLPHLIGLVCEDTNRRSVVGFIIPFFKGVSLDTIKVASSILKDKWNLNLQNTINFLHGNQLIWGDVKPANILVDEDNEECFTVIDFGGSYSSGWVDRELCETEQGDLQGMQKIFDFIAKIPES